MNPFVSSSKPVALVFLTMLISACATPINSTIDVADDVEISEFESYAWISDKPYVGTDAAQSELANPLNYQRIRAGIDAQLAQKGYVKVAASEADLVLGVTLGTRDRVRVQQFYNGFGFNSFGRYRGFNRFGSFNRFSSHNYSFGTGTRVRTTTEGAVALDLFDRKERTAVWHGHASQSLSGDATGENLISDAVSALVGSIPARSSISKTMGMTGESEDNVM